MRSWWVPTSAASPSIVSADIGREALLPALHLLQPERAERRGDAPPDLATRDFGQFHRVSADVADQPLGLGPAEKHALCRKPRFLLAVDDPELEPGLLLGLCLEFRSVLGIPHGGRGDAGQRRKPHTLRQRGEALQRRQCPDPALRAEAPGLSQALAEPGHHLLVVEIGRAAGGAVEDNEADRVGPDIDDADTFEGAGGGVVEQRPPERRPVIRQGLEPRLDRPCPLVFPGVDPAHADGPSIQCVGEFGHVLGPCRSAARQRRVLHEKPVAVEEIVAPLGQVADIAAVRM